MFNQIPKERGFVWNYGPEEPFVKAPLPEQEKRLAELDRELRERRQGWEAVQPDLRAAQAQWESGAATHAADWTPERDLAFRADVPGRSTATLPSWVFAAVHIFGLDRTSGRGRRHPHAPG